MPYTVTTEEAFALAKLSHRARSLYARLREGEFYESNGGPIEQDPRIPRAMQELVDAGLAARAGRVKVICSAYIPVGYFKPFEWEKITDAPA